jgi:recombination associated protein RdgC
MYKNISVFSLDDHADLSKLNSAVHDFKFEHVTNHQLCSAGWESPIDSDLAYTIDYGKATLLVMRKEERIIPAASVAELLKEAVIEEEMLIGRKPSKKERALLKEDILIRLIPHTLLKTTRVQGYVDLSNNRIVVNTGSINQAEEFISLLRHTLGGLPAFNLYVDGVNENEVFTRWVNNSDSLTAHFDLSDACKLVSENAKTVTFKNFALWNNTGINEHINNGMYVSEIRLCYKDKITFTLNDKLQFKSIEHVIQEVELSEGTTAEEQFVIDSLIDINSHRELIASMVEELQR